MPAADVAGRLVRGNVVAVGLPPVRAHALREPHGHHHFGIAPAGFGQALTRNGKLDGRLGRLARHDFGQDGQANQQDGTAQGRDAENPVEGEDDGQVERHPGQVEQGRRDPCWKGRSARYRGRAAAAGCRRVRPCAPAGEPWCRRHAGSGSRRAWHRRGSKADCGSDQSRPAPRTARPPESTVRSGSECCGSAARDRRLPA